MIQYRWIEIVVLIEKKFVEMEIKTIISILIKPSHIILGMYLYSSNSVLILKVAEVPEFGG